MIIDGKQIAQQYTNILKEHLIGSPGLAAILVGNNSSSRIYINQKRKKAEEIGIQFQCLELPHDTKPEALSHAIQSLNENDKIHGIILQLPLPSHLKSEIFLKQISSEKDVDGLHPYNLGSLFQDHIHFAPCTPQGCIQLIKTVVPDLSGKRALILGRSNLVGKPLIHLLLKQNATIQSAHSKSQNIQHLCHHNDIIITAMGVPQMIDETYVKDHHIIIDVGISKVGDHIYGDVNFDKVSPIVQYISPVPGGVGPMTVFNLMLNTVIGFYRTNRQPLPHTLAVLSQTH